MEISWNFEFTCNATCTLCNAILSEYFSTKMKKKWDNEINLFLISNLAVPKMVMICIVISKHIVVILDLNSTNQFTMNKVEKKNAKQNISLITWFQINFNLMHRRRCMWWRIKSQFQVFFFRFSNVPKVAWLCIHRLKKNLSLTRACCVFIKLEYQMPVDVLQCYLQCYYGRVQGFHM